MREPCGGIFRKTQHCNALPRSSFHFGPIHSTILQACYQDTSNAATPEKAAMLSVNLRRPHMIDRGRREVDHRSGFAKMMEANRMSVFRFMERCVLSCDCPSQDIKNSSHEGTVIIKHTSQPCPPDSCCRLEIGR
jgi:hypothetical protein